MRTLINELSALLGASSLFIGDDISEKYYADWSGADPCAPVVLVKPKTTDQLSKVMALCHQYDQPVVVQGGLTGLAGGATPLDGELAVSLERMQGIEEIDPLAMTLTALAGTPLQVLQDAADEHNLSLPLDLGARGSCQIGGNVSTNAGGTEVIRYGMTRSLVLGLEAVLADGTVITAMNKMVKNNSGYDLKHLFIGSEGTLGIVTRVVLQLQPKAGSSHTALCGLNSYESATRLLVGLKASLGSGLTGFELMWDNYYNKVLEMVTDIADPLEGKFPFYLLVEYKDNNAELGSERFESALFQQLELGVIADAVIAKSHQDAAIFWQIRDGIGELLQVLGPVSNQDVSLPISEIGVFGKNRRFMPVPPQKKNQDEIVCEDNKKDDSHDSFLLLKNSTITAIEGSRILMIQTKSVAIKATAGSIPAAGRRITAKDSRTPNSANAKEGTIVLPKYTKAMRMSSSVVSPSKPNAMSTHINCVEKTK